MSRKALWAAFALVASVSPALSHPGHLSVSGLGGGLAHPLGGMDHVLAMVAVGLLAAQLGGRAVWLLPVAFVSTMVLGGALGLAAIELPFVEVAIALSAIAFGLAIALRLAPPVGVAAAFVAAFAIFHGHAHGVEMPAEASALGYAAGFVTATALLHVAGLAFGFAVTRLSAARLVQAAGCGTALAGVALLAKLV